MCIVAKWLRVKPKPSPPPSKAQEYGYPMTTTCGGCGSRIGPWGGSYGFQPVYVDENFTARCPDNELHYPRSVIQ